MIGPYTRMYIAVPDADAEEVGALGAIKVAPEKMKEHRMLGRIRLKPGMSVWYYIDKDPNLFVKWPFITFEFILGHDDVTEEDEFESKNVFPRLDDDDPFGAIAEREVDRHDDIIAQRLEVKPDGQDSSEEPATAVKAGT